MLYDRHNAAGAKVYDVGTCEQIRLVMSVDTEAGLVVAAHDPPRMLPSRDGIDTYEIRFRAIHAIRGGSDKPVLFHCYDRLQESPAGLPCGIRCDQARGHWGWR